MEPILFDTERINAVNLRTQAGVKTIRVRFPSDEQWTQRQKRCKVLVKQLGRGTSETTVLPSEDADSALINDLWAEEKDAVELDKYEAAKVIDTLALSKVEGIKEEPEGFAVTLRVLGGVTVHHVNMPFESDKAEYRRLFAKVLDLPYGQQQVTVNLAVVAPIYKRLIGQVEGYSGAVPIIHQSAVLKAAIDKSDSISDDSDTENFR